MLNMMKIIILLIIKVKIYYTKKNKKFDFKFELLSDSEE